MKSKQQKIAAGTYRPDREKTLVTTDPLLAVPEPDYQLNQTEMQYFTRAAKLLIAAGTLTDGDLPGLTRAASWYGIWQTCLADIRQNGSWQTTASGWTAKTAAFQAGMDAEKSLTAWEKSQGLNLTARSKLPPPEPAAVPNPFDEF